MIKALTKKLNFWIFVGIVAGLALGLYNANYVKPEDFNAGYMALATKLGGDIFMSMLKGLILPLVFVSIVCGVLAIGHPKDFGRLGLKTLAYYFVTTSIAVCIGLGMVNVIKPGTRSNSEQLIKEAEKYRSKAEEKQAVKPEGKKEIIVNLIGKIFPSNLPKAVVVDKEVLPVIFWAMVTGFGLVVLGETVKPVTDVFHALNHLIMELVKLVMLTTPVGVFCIITYYLSQTGFDTLLLLGWFGVTVVSGLAIHGLVVIPCLLYFLGKINPRKYAIKIRAALATAFGTDSSSATLPVTLECVTEEAKVPEKYGGFVLPLGATVNMDGTALFEGVCVIFIAQIFNFDLTMGSMVVIFLTATLASIGAAAIPSAGVVMLLIVLDAVEMSDYAFMVGLLLIVDRFLDMCRTTVNVWGDAAGAAIMAKLEGEKLPEVDR